MESNTTRSSRGGAYQLVVLRRLRGPIRDGGSVLRKPGGKKGLRSLLLILTVARDSGSHWKPAFSGFL